jgi:hypothetical protein
MREMRGRPADREKISSSFPGLFAQFVATSTAANSASITDMFAHRFVTFFDASMVRPPRLFNYRLGRWFNPLYGSFVSGRIVPPRSTALSSPLNPADSG